MAPGKDELSYFFNAPKARCQRKIAAEVLVFFRSDARRMSSVALAMACALSVGSVMVTNCVCVCV